jgi:hypothetical protein
MAGHTPVGRRRAFAALHQAAKAAFLKEAFGLSLAPPA